MQAVVNKVVKKLFGNADVKVRFEFIESDSTKPSEYLELA